MIKAAMNRRSPKRCEVKFTNTDLNQTLAFTWNATPPAGVGIVKSLLFPYIPSCTIHLHPCFSIFPLNGKQGSEDFMVKKSLKKNAMANPECSDEKAVLSPHFIADQKRAEELAAANRALEAEIAFRKEAEEALRESEQRQKAILNTIPDPAWLKDKEGRFLIVNAAWCRFFGVKAEEVLGKTDYECFTAEVAESFSEPDQNVIESRLPLHYEESLRDKDGCLFWFETVKYPLYNEQGDVVGISGIARDITERKQAETILAAQHDLTFRLAGARQLDEVLHYCLDAAISISDLDCGGIYLVDSASGEFRLMHHLGLGSEFCEALAVIQSGSVPVKYLDGGTTVVIPRHRMEELGLARAVYEGLFISLVIPVVNDGRIIASLNLGSHTATTLSPRTQEAVEAMAAQMGAAIARAQAEESLRQSESILRGCFDSPGIMRGIVEIVGDEILHISDNAVTAAFFGRTQESMRNKFSTEMGVSKDIVRMWIGYYEESRRENHSVSFEYSHPSGNSESWLYATVSFLDSKATKNPRYTYVVIDITARKRAEEALRLANTYNRSLIEVSLDPLVTIGPDGKITDVNAATEEVTGCSRTELIGTDFSDYFTESEMARAGYQRVFREGFVRDYALELRHHDGHVTSVLYNASIYRDAGGNVIGVFAVARDITKRKRAEEALRESQQRLYAVVEGTSDAVFIKDLKGRYLLINKAASCFVGKNVEEIIGHDDTFLFPLDEARAVMEGDRRVMAECKTATYEEHLTTVDGVRRVFQSTKGPIFDANGKVSGLFGVDRDITEQIRNRKDIDFLHMELIHAGRLMAMGELASGIAHEINQPLSIVTTWAEVAMREINEKLQGDKEEVLLSLQRISDAIERAGNIVNRMKHFSRKSKMQKTALSLNEILGEVYPLVEHKLRIDGVETVVELDPGLPVVLADQTQIQQVLLNLIRNAAEAMESTGLGARKIEIRGRVQEGKVEVSVRDSGCGIPPEELEKVFEPFHTSKPDGMGLGLSICRTIIENHGGRIWARRNPDCGATVAFTLPLAEEHNGGS
jgi:PAS domain S-box-containing protein